MRLMPVDEEDAGSVKVLVRDGRKELPKLC